MNTKIANTAEPTTADKSKPGPILGAGYRERVR